MNLFVTASLILLVSPVLADFKVQFKSGDVKVQRANKTDSLKIGDKLPTSATVMTGADGRAALIDMSSGNVVMIAAGKTVLLSSVTGAAVHDPNTLRQEMSKRQANTIAAVRADAMGKPDSAIGWDEGSAAVDHSAHWELYKSGKYEQVKSATAAAKDPEGQYLHMQATYMVSGAKDAAKVENTLLNLLSSNLSIPLKSEASRTLAAIAFERGEFDKAFTQARRAAKTRSAADIDAALYYILVISARMNGEDTAANAALADMHKYHADSPLLKKLD